ncbi:transposase [Rhizobium leguminosarum]|nr:transposase [Rhizobium leguminosarum]
MQPEVTPSPLMGRSSVCGLENRMKHFRRFAARYDRTAIHFEGFIYLPASMIWLR